MSNIRTERVLSVRHWTDKLFSFRTTRSRSFRFESGQFVMMGLPVEGKNLVRAYSLASAQHEEELEFFSIKVPDGPLTSRLQKIQIGDEVLVGAKATGTLVFHSLLPGRRLFLLSTGTGLAPFVSIVKDPTVYELYDQVFLVHGCRWQRETEYGSEIVRQLREDELMGELVRPALVHLPLTTREATGNQPRITDLTASGELFQLLGASPFDSQTDRFMVCGNTAFLADIHKVFDGLGLKEGSNARPGQFVVERAFVER